MLRWTSSFALKYSPSAVVFAGDKWSSLVTQKAYQSGPLALIADMTEKLLSLLRLRGSLTFALQCHLPECHSSSYFLFLKVL